MIVVKYLKRNIEFLKKMFPKMKYLIERKVKVKFLIFVFLFFVLNLNNLWASWNNPVEHLDESDGAHYDGLYYCDNGNWFAQMFTARTDYFITSVELYIHDVNDADSSKVGEPLIVKIYTDNSGKPGTPILGAVTSNVGYQYLSWVKFEFPQLIQVFQSNKYHIVAYNYEAKSNGYTIASDDTNKGRYSGGWESLSKNQGSTWTIFSNDDLYFRVNVNFPPKVLQVYCEGAVNPVNVLDPTPDLSWDFSDVQTGEYQIAYRIQVGTNGSFSNVWNPGWVNTSENYTVYAGPSLIPGKMYQWRVQVKDEYSLVSGWKSGTFTMSANLAPDTPENIDLFNNARYGNGAFSITPTMEWTNPYDVEGDPLHFEFQWCTNILFSPPTGARDTSIDPTGFSPGPFPVPPGFGTIRYTFQFSDGLKNGKTYFWRVRAKDFNNSEWSKIFSFTVDTSLNSPYWFQTMRDQFSFDTFKGTKITNFFGDDAIALSAQAKGNEVTVFGPESFEASFSWNKWNNETGNEWGWYGGTGADGTSYIAVVFDTVKVQDAWVETPKINLKGYKNCKLHFFMECAYGGYNEDFRVWISTNGGGQSGIWIPLTNYKGDTPTVWKERIIDLSAFDGHTNIHIAWQYDTTASGKNQDTRRIDLISVTAYTPEEGRIYSQPIHYNDFKGKKYCWDKVFWNENTLNGDILIDVEYWDGLQWQKTPFVDLTNSSGEDISSLNTDVYSNIRLIGKLIKGNNGTPFLLDWSISWCTNHMIVVKKNKEIPDYNVNTNAINQVVMSLNIYDVAKGHYLKRFTLKNVASNPMLDGADISKVKIWMDSGTKQNKWDNLDVFIAELKWDNVGMVWTNNNINFSTSLDNPGIDIIVTIDISGAPTLGRNFQAMVPVGSISCDSNASGPQSDITNLGIQTVAPQPENILLIGDVSTNNKCINRIEQILTNAGYIVTKQLSADTNPDEWINYKYIVWNSEGDSTPINDGDTFLRDKLIEYVNDGGLLVLTGGDIASTSESLNWTEFMQKVLHISDYISAFSYSSINKTNTHFINTNNGIGASLPISVNFAEDIDAVKSYSDALPVYTLASGGTNMEVIAYDSITNTKTKGQIVYIAFILTNLNNDTDEEKLLLNCISWLEYESPPQPPGNLLTDGQTTPIDIVNKHPVFSWSYYDEDGNPQKAYRLQVGTSSNTNDMWDTGIVFSSSNSVTYNGTALVSNTKYYWRVIVWDTTDAKSEWSSTWFKTGP